MPGCSRLNKAICMSEKECHWVVGKGCKSNVPKSTTVKGAKTPKQLTTMTKQKQPFTMTKQALVKMWKSIHPDGQIANAAKDRVLALQLKNEDAVAAVLDMAGAKTVYERNKRITSVEDVDAAYIIYKRGNKAFEKEMLRLEELRKVYVAKFLQNLHQPAAK